MGGKGILVILMLLPLINFFYIPDTDTSSRDFHSLLESYPHYTFDAVGKQGRNIIRDEKKAVLSIITQHRYSLIDTRVEDLAEMIVKIAGKYELSPKFIASVIAVESSFDSYAVSNMDARGLMQITPDTAEYLNNRYRLVASGEINLFDKRLNIELGTLYIKELIERYGSVKKAMTAYNYGPGRVDTFISRNMSMPAKYYNSINDVLIAL